MAEKNPPKMTREDHEDGSSTYRFAHGAEIKVSLDQFPANVREFFATFGMLTKVRNFTAIEKDETGAAAGSEAMHAKMLKGVELLKQGVLRAAAEAGDKRSGGTLLLEAAFIYRQKKAKAQGVEFTETETDVAKAIEALTEEQLKGLKETSMFKLAMEEAKMARQAARLAAAQKAAEAEEAGA